MHPRHLALLAVAVIGGGCRFEDRTPGGAGSDEASLQQVAASFYQVMARGDVAATDRITFSSSTVLVDDGRGVARVVPVHTMLGLPDRRTSDGPPRIVRTELRTDGAVATARVVIAVSLPSEMEATDILTLARDGSQWRIAHAVFGPWRRRGAP